MKSNIPLDNLAILEDQGDYEKAYIKLNFLHTLLTTGSSENLPARKKLASQLQELMMNVDDLHNTNQLRHSDDDLTKLLENTYSVLTGSMLPSNYLEYAETLQDATQLRLKKLGEILVGLALICFAALIITLFTTMLAVPIMVFSAAATMLFLVGAPLFLITHSEGLLAENAAETGSLEIPSLLISGNP